MKLEPKPSAPKPHLPGNSFGPRPLDSIALLGGRDEILIAHGGDTYRLRRTRQGKLILTK